METRNVISGTIVWRGLRIEITHVTGYFSGMDHIEIHTEDKTPIPITETGYKSHFSPLAVWGSLKQQSIMCALGLSMKPKAKLGRHRNFLRSK